MQKTDLTTLTEAWTRAVPIRAAAAPLLALVLALALLLSAGGAQAQATVVSAGTLCPSVTRELTATNLISNSSFSNTATSPGNGGGVGQAPFNTEPANNNVAYQSGLRIVTTGAPDLNQDPFPGDAARGVAASNHWLLANGNTLGTPGVWWSQPVTGLTPERTYTFLVYASSPTAGAQNGGNAQRPNLQLRITQATAQTATLGLVLADTAAADVWRLYQATFEATQTTATLAVLNSARAPVTGGAGERRGMFALAQPTLHPCASLIDLRVTKTNAVTALVAGGTTRYTVTVANYGPEDADDSVLRDVPGPGLACSGISCTAALGGAACPAAGTGPGQLSIGNLVPPGTGVRLDTLPPNSTLSFGLVCDVTATGT